MKSILPLVSFVLLLTSCTSAYKSGQTPDDVYFSPERPTEEYVKSDEKEEEEPDYRESDRYSRDDDRYVRMKVRDRSRWSVLDEYYSDPYAYSYKGCYCQCDYNPRLYWSKYYNPYSNPVIVYNPKSPVINKPRNFNLHVFDNPQNNTYNPKAPGTQSRQYNKPSTTRSNTSSNSGTILRGVFGSGSNSSSSSGSTSSSTSSGSSSKPADNNSGKSGSSPAPVRKF